MQYLKVPLVKSINDFVWIILFENQLILVYSICINLQFKLQYTPRKKENLGRSNIVSTYSSTKGNKPQNLTYYTNVSLPLNNKRCLSYSKK